MKRVTILFLTGLVFMAFFAPRYAGAQTPAQAPADTGAFRQEGIASWYGNQFNGRPTASGEIFNSNLYTAAHPTLPFGTLLLVTNSSNGRQVVVRVNDRGPFVAGRIIDLSRVAAERLDMLGSGTAMVVLEYTNMPIGYYGQTALPQSAPPTAAKPSSGIVLTPEVAPIPPRTPATQSVTQAPQSIPPATQPVQTPQSAPETQYTPPAQQSPTAPIIQYIFVPAPQSVPPATQYIPPETQLIPSVTQSAPPAQQSVPLETQPTTPVTQSILPAPDILPVPVPEPEIVQSPVTPDYKAPDAPKPSSTAAVIKPSIPPADNGKIYRIQAGSFKVARNALDAFDKLKAAGLNPAYEKSGDMYRVVLGGVPSADITLTAEKLGAAGFKEALIREE
ncbi:endolytic peptidoglycan transglycosylase RlpA [Spirochaetia bacterium]|nr:endolytic peptidoglycan transglycosylase RlpA [Spirochaetia bacterium]